MFWSMFPLTRATHFGTGFLSHSHIFRTESVPQPSTIPALKAGSVATHNDESGGFPLVLRQLVWGSRLN